MTRTRVFECKDGKNICVGCFGDSVQEGHRLYKLMKDYKEKHRTKTMKDDCTYIDIFVEPCKMISVVMVPAEGQPYPCIIENSLKAFQQAVGGYIETVRVTKRLMAIVNEEGRLIGLPKNHWISGIVGNAVLVSFDNDSEEFLDFPEDMLPLIFEFREG